MARVLMEVKNVRLTAHEPHRLTCPSILEYPAENWGIRTSKAACDVDL